jgi:hypothetical protein
MDTKGNGINNCWEFWNCPNEVRDDCPAFLTYHGKDCFDFAGNYCQRKDSGFQHCRDCPWYKNIKSTGYKKGNKITIEVLQ